MRAAVAALALLLAARGGAEEIEYLDPEAAAEAVEEIEWTLEEGEPEPTQTPEPTVRAKPLPTLEPGSINYPANKVNFENEIWTYLIRGWGLKDFQAAGLMSSIYAESGFCPYNAERCSGADARGRYAFSTGDSVGFGLCQWTFPDRKKALYSYAVAHGDPNLVWDFDIQMGFMKNEIPMGELKAAQSLYEATEWAVLRYERPDQSYRNSWPGSRYVIARQIFRNHTGRDYEEPELAFYARTSEGADAAAGCSFAEAGCRLTVGSNYYWRVRCDVPWIEVCGLDEDGVARKCVCGYAREGEKTLALKLRGLPLTRRARLTFGIYYGDYVKVTVPLAYTGQTLGEWIAAFVGRLLPERWPGLPSP